MAYIGNQLQTAQPNYQIIDDISGSFDGTTTTFALQVGGVTPTPFPVSAQHCIISVGGVVQEPDPTGTNGFLLSGSNIVFSSAPSSGESFFGTVLAGADYINVGASFPDGSVANPSITFDQDLDTGLYRSASGTTSISANGTNVADFGPSVVTFDTGGSESVRIDSSGRLLVGTASTSAQCSVLVKDNSGSSGPGILRIHSSVDTPVDGATLGLVAFGANNDSPTSWMFGARDGGTWTAGSSQPTRLVFSTTLDGASSPTERVRIANNGDFFIGKTAVDNTVTGLSYVNPTSTAAYLSVANNSTNSNARVVYVNRQGSDGKLIEFAQANSVEGVISVSGTTVTYGGGHLARWSQLINNEDPSNILRGTVLSNLDEMCEWEGEDNEQLNKTKVSDVEGDPNVAGVFVSTSFDEVGSLDFFVGMTGDLIIRIAQGVTVQRGDLLMSAGDGTAKPQDDDIIRSKTIAKVTSTHVTCTYDDGSYCVPCVLMAC